MKRHAVLLTVLFVFGVTVASVSYTFLGFYKLNREQYINNTFMKYTVIARIYREHMQNRTSEAMLEANLAIYNLYPVESFEEAKKIVNRAQILKREGFQAVGEAFIFEQRHLFKKRTVQELRASMLQYKGDIYFFIEGPENAVLLHDDKLKPYAAWNLLYAYLTITSIITLSYMLILMRLRPLRRLQRRIAAFGAGNMQVSFKMRGEDEIALVANELENTRLKIQALIESRTLFMRNIMHELKTPIAKGRISAEMVENPKQKERFTRIFERMESLINEFALIEEVSTGFKHADLCEYRIIDLIDGAIDKAMVEHSHVVVEVDAARKIDADFNLFSTAIKNMIDNAMKYSPEKKIRIRMVGNEIWFESRGKKLSHPLSYYVEPFTKEHPARDSFGLGLYLVDAILQAHKMVLAYEYEEGINRFIFVPVAKPA
jgi:two-component system OmpR family sensor kinase